MLCFKRYIISFCCLFLALSLPAQNLTGTWEGDMGTYQFLQLNIVQKGDIICGYTWDHITYSQKDFCKAYFEATYDKKRKKLIISGTSFFENSGSHTLMQLELWYKKVKAEEALYYRPSRMEIIQALIEGVAVESAIYLTKVSDKPNHLLPGITECLEKNDIVKNKTKDTVLVKDSVAIVQVPEKRRDTLINMPPPPGYGKEDIAIPEQLNQRKNIEQSRITVNVKTINLKVYDNAITDGDTVSILYNGKMLLSHQLLSEKAIDIDLILDEKQTRHEIVLFAENLGSIPPNTALIVITAGDKRYELFASASLQENAVLVFDYHPK